VVGMCCKWYFVCVPTVWDFGEIFTRGAG